MQHELFSSEAISECPVSFVCICFHSAALEGVAIPHRQHNIHQQVLQHLFITAQFLFIVKTNQDWF